MEVWSAALLGVVQGLTEFLPVSSSGHLILVEKFLGIQGKLSFDAFIHLGTLMAVLLYFRKEWREILSGIFRPGEGRQLLLMLVLGTLPGAVAGVVLEGSVENYFRRPGVVALVLVMMSLPLVLGEILGRREKDWRSLGFGGALLIGLAQALALIPGTSRSGITIAAGLLLGLTRAEAARFSFLLSAPIIAGAGILEGVKALAEGLSPKIMFLGAFSAFLSGWLAISFLLRFLRTRSLYPFVVYRVALGALILLLWPTPSIAAPPFSRVVTLITAQGPPERLFQERPRGITTGLLLPGGRYVLAAYPEVKQAIFIEALLPEGTTLPARLKAYDRFTDLAFLELSAQVRERERLRILRDWPSPGTQVLLITRTFKPAVYPGWVIRAPALRRVRGYLRADLLETVLTGDRSGPLFLPDGRLCGFHVKGAGGTEFQLAEASWIIERAFRQFLKKGRVEWPWLGVETVPLSPVVARAAGFPVEKGLLVIRVYPGSPADAVKLRAGKRLKAIGNVLYPLDGDLILAADDLSLSSPEDLFSLILSKEPGEVLRLKVWRSGRIRYIKVKLTRRPEG